MKLKRSLLVALALAGTLVFTGCGGSEDAQAPEDTTSDVVETEEDDKKEETAETGEPVEMDFFYYDGLRAFRSDSAIWEQVQEDNNIILNGVAPTTPGGEAEEQFNLMLASGEIPDIIHASKANIMKNTDRLVLPLDDLIDEHAPNLKAFLEDNEIVDSAARGTDGKIYTIPYIPDGQVSETWFIRKDWLDKLDLDIPETVEEYEHAIRAFREEDVNETGKKDVVGYFDRENSSGIAGIFNLYGSSFAAYVKDGEIIDDKYTEGFKDSVKNIERLYSEGLIDPEIYTRGKDTRDVMFQQNIGASTVDWIASTALYQNQYEDEIEGLEWVAMLPPKNTNGESMIQYARFIVSDWGWSIGKDAKDPVAAIKLFDYMFTDEGIRLMNWGIEGETYEMVDGQPVFKDEVLNADKAVTDQMQDLGYLQVGYPQDFEYERQWTEESALEGIELYMEEEPFLDIVSNLGLVYTGDELETISKLQPALNSYTSEMIQKWVLGSEDIDASFDGYLKKAEELGYREILDIYQAAYDRAYK